MALILLVTLQVTIAFSQNKRLATKEASEEFSVIKQNSKDTIAFNAKNDLALITEVLLDYIEGTANGQPERLKKAFHADFNLYFVGQDSLRIWKGKEYVGNIKEGEKNDRQGKIVSIDFENNAASAKIEIDIPSRKRIYTDYLLLLKYQGSWKIIHKSFTFKEYPILSEKAQKMDKVLSAYHEFDLFNGTVLIAQNGKDVLKKSYGKANFAWDINNTPTTKFRIGSLTKQFTALLILQLKQEGKLTLEDKINTHLPWYFKNTGSKLTIHHLLSMTSGLPNYTDEANAIMEREELMPKDFALKYFKDTLLFEPGKNIRYCNTGYYILGMIIEAVTKKSYEAVLQEKVFDILGMKNSGIETPNQLVSNLAEGYTFYMGEYIIPHSINMKTMTFSAGTIYSTVEDLFLWDKSFYSDKLLSAENKKLMCTKYFPNYGYGVAVNSMKNYLGLKKDINLISHDGGIGGFSSYMARIPEDSIFVVLLDNTRAGMRGGDLVAISNNIIPILYNVQVEIPKPLASIELMKLVKLKSVDAGIIHFKNLISIDKATYDFTGFESSLNSMGYNYLSNGDLISAIKILKLNTDEFPKSGNAHDSLGEVYFANNQFDLALEHYAKSLELDPKNQNAKTMIEKIKKAK